MRKTLFLILISLSLFSYAKRDFTISRHQLLNKIKGGWAGQTIGCTYGGPTEFRYRGETIPDSIAIEWPKGRIKWYFEHGPGLYDDVYMDLTFVSVFDRLGLDAPVDSFAHAFAHARYHLWHANQAARYNILNGILPPKSGHWTMNPHADCIDYQIEADYAGLMSPGMPNQASKFSDKIGHIMNYGNGWYGGVFVGAMYSMAFLTDDIPYIINEALKTIPKKSSFHKCISDIINWHSLYPTDWKKTWQLCEDKYSHEVGCPEGALAPLDIDALINSAYIVIGLLYGEGDFAKTLEISTRCGQDSDCNPASAGGILGTIIGYNKISSYWMDNLHEAEDIPFAYTSLSLNQVYQMSYDHALKVIKRNGGQVTSDKVCIKTQKPKAVRFEKCFPGLEPKEIGSGQQIKDIWTYDFEGAGIVISGQVKSKSSDYVARIEVTLDGKRQTIVEAPAAYRTRTPELYWNYQLKQGPHHLVLKLLNPQPDTSVESNRIVVYKKK